MSDDKPKKDNDLTRIEDLSEFLHSEEDDDFAGLSTDPDISLPDLKDEGIDGDNNSEYEVQDEPETDYSTLEEQDDFPINDGFDENNTDEDFNNNFESDLDSEFETNLDTNLEDISDNFQEYDTSFDFSNELDSTFDDASDKIPDHNSDDSSDHSPDDDYDNEFNKSFDNDITDTNPSPSLDTSPVEITTPDSLELQDTEENRKNDEALDIEEIRDEKEQDLFQEEVKQEIPNLPTDPQSSNYDPPETFKDLQQFSKNISYGNLSHEGTPPFSIILKDIKYQEDLDDIVIYLKEFKILKEEDEDSARKTLARGSFLIPRLSEYAAILLCHKLRRFELTILMGLTEEITPAKSYTSDDSGLATKNNIYNNRSHNWLFEKKELTLKDVIACNTAIAEGYEIIEYIGITTEFAIINEEDLNSTDQEESTSLNNSIYLDLIEKLKSHALHKKGNGVVGINFTLSPLVKSNRESIQQYKVNCTGNIVWLIKK